MRYATVFSGIEAPTVAWECLGWEPQWFAEIEPFPSGALDHIYPNVPNLGDMTKLKDTLTDEQKNIQVLCGGSPCQSFSIAGLREGLADPRGNLTLEYVRLVDAVRPEWVIWENVPGVLSANGGHDFKAFLDAMGHVGYFGAYRVLDAQYFGVPQRRRRVFAIFCPGDGTRAVEVLFERKSLCGYTPPSREAGARVTPLAPSGVGTCGDRGVAYPLRSRAQMAHDESLDTLVMAHGQGGAEIMEGHAPALSCNHEAPIAFTSKDDGRDAMLDLCPTLRVGGGTKRDGPVEPAVVIGVLGDRSHALTGEGHDASEDGTGRGTPIAAISSVVRRLTEIECERLQGFPDNYTRIPWKGKPAADCPLGPRYKALGNSMAVPVMRWIGTRIHLLEAGLGVYL